MEHIGAGRMKHSDSLVAWRSLVRDELRSYVRVNHPMVAPDDTWRGPVAVRCIFVRADGKGDIDKLARAVLDALTESGVIADDVQVVKLVCDRVERAGARRGDGVFVLVATAEDFYAEEMMTREIDGWVPR